MKPTTRQGAASEAQEATAPSDLTAEELARCARLGGQHPQELQGYCGTLAALEVRTAIVSNR